MLAARGVLRTYPAGSTLLAQDTRNDHLIALLEGFVAEEHVSPDGRRAIVSLHGPGDLLGEVSLIGRDPALASARVLKRVDAVLVPRWRVRREVAEGGEIAGELLAAVARRARRAGETVVDLSLSSVDVRVSRRLMRLAESWGVNLDGAVEIPVALRQEDLAAWAGVSYQAAVRSLAELRNDGIVVTGRRRVRIDDVERLRERALLA